MAIQLSEKIIILNVIKSGNISSQYLNNLMGYKKISYIIENLIENELIIYNEDRLNITSSGIDYINKFNRRYNKKGMDKFLLPDERYKINKIDKEDIFLP